MTKKRQAVVIIHGIGEQRPMDTLRGFVDAVWTRDASVQHPQAQKFADHPVWSKPDGVSPGFELRRLSTPKNRAGIETDFFEFYWAHMLSETSYAHVGAWAAKLVMRGPGSVPAPLRSVHALAWLALLLSSAFAVLTGVLGVWPAPVSPGWVALAAGVTLVPLARFVTLKIVGDAARYLHVAPANIQCRHAIRAAGVELVEALHGRVRRDGKTPEYDRIVMVGHSLGSVIAYDILTHAWPHFHKEHDPDATTMTALDELEGLAALAPPAAAETVQPVQRRYCSELKENGCRWRVTDLVTLGSPLTYAALLLARDARELAERQDLRELPRCLPMLERQQRDGKVVRRFSYEQGRRGKNAYRVPHHAAVFGPTRWTNLFFPARWLVWGDLVGGPLASVMGAQVRDVPVSTTRWGGLLSHTLYWDTAAASAAGHLEPLRKALDLCDDGRAPAAAPRPDDEDEQA